jgi:L-aspartate oxidase
MGDKHISDVLILGMGIAGLTAALEAADNGLRVNLLTKNENTSESNTRYAQGGIVGYNKEDSQQLLYEDILRAGCYINNRDAVRFVANKGPGIVGSFLVERAGVDFSRNYDGDHEFTKEAAHSIRRILHSHDETGLAIIEGLIRSVEEHKNITIFQSSMALDLITNCHHSQDSQQRYLPKKVIGVYSLNCISGKVESYFAGSVVLATGGIGNLYQHTSNPSCATGDGIAMAYRAGAEVINGEYVQFHPTTLFHKDISNFLISESLRGEGAILVNHRGEAFMSRYNKELKDLAPRDEVSRAIYTEMELDGSDCVFLDAKCIKGFNIEERFPKIFNTCTELGIDIRKDLIPVVPAAHYFCGGIKVDLNGKTGIDGLYVIGESACTGLHGANRLASVSLLEGAVLGFYSAREICRINENPNEKLLETIPDWIYPKKEEVFDSILIGSDLITIQTIMWNYVGIKRSEKRLKRALSDLNYLHHRVERFYQQAIVNRDIVELRNSLETAMLITRAALANPKSLGCHYIPKKGD